MSSHWHESDSTRQPLIAEFLVIEEPSAFELTYIKYGYN